MTIEVMNPLYAETKLFRKDSKLYRLCETERAEMFLCATKFNMDAVFTKVSLFDKPDDLFAADITSHKQCMNRLIKLALPYHTTKNISLGTKFITNL